MTPGQKAYELELTYRPAYGDGTARPAWDQLSAVARLSWERNPTWRGNGQRRQLRRLLIDGASMARADELRRAGHIGLEAHRRFVRLWAVSTATEHPYTARWSLERWRSRRAVVTRAVLRFLAREAPDAAYERARAAGYEANEPAGVIGPTFYAWTPGGTLIGEYETAGAAKAACVAAFIRRRTSN